MILYCFFAVCFFYNIKGGCFVHLQNFVIVSFCLEKKAQRNFLWVALLALGTIGILARHNRAVPYQTVSGLIFGTVYNITYQYDSNLKAEIEAELKRFDGSLSPFNDTATITRINRNEEIIPDTFFTNVFRRSMEISRETQGAF